MKPTTPEAYKLFHEGVQTLTRVEHNGIKIDLDYLTKAEKGLDQKIKNLSSHLYDSEVYETWRKLYGKKTNIDSADQLGRILFDELKIPYVGERTATGKYSTDDEVLRTIDLPWVKSYLQRKKYYKARHTFLANIRNETVDGLLHPFFDLHTVQTFRSCIAKGSKVKIVTLIGSDGHAIQSQDILIENVKIGDRVWCTSYHNNCCHMVVGHVTWAGKTGHEKVIRLHWKWNNTKGHLDLTPDHKVRLNNGQYIRADQIKKGGRSVWGHLVITEIEELPDSVDVYDIEVEEFHNFIANEICVHNSSRSPNFQNFPSRDPEITKIIRTCFIARKDRQLLEMDFSGIEVRIACVYTKDPRLIDDFTTPGKDPHRDTASQLFCLPIEFLKANADWAKKTVRDWSKNRFVFPEFYGSVHFQCAPHIWESIIEKGDDGYKFKLPDGTSIKKHLARKGIKELGEVHPDIIKEQGGTKAGTYVHHVKKVEDDFWNNRFKGYTQWKKDWYAAYLRTGGFHTLSGFKIEGVMKRNEVLNYPIQGFAFHCLLWTLIQLDKWLRKNKMKSLIVGQIHDSMVLDAIPKEVPIILEKVKEIVSKGLPQNWPCIIVPMEIEAELCPIGGSWYDKKKV